MSEKLCAFCGKAGPLTREHVWPKCIIERTADYDARYYGRTGKFFRGELAVRDVCSECNNGPLSVLDSYICGLYDARLHRIVTTRNPTVLRYDYDRLLRWLLKISYNSARSNNSNVSELQEYSGYVLNGGHPPVNISIRLEIVLPAKNPQFKRGTSALRFLPPRSVRCMRVELTSGPIAGHIVRLVGINSFYFWILIALDTGGEIAGENLNALPKAELSPYRSTIKIWPGPKNTLDIHRDWFRDERAVRSFKILTDTSQS